METRELTNRAVQAVVGSILFELPVLKSLRSLAYRLLFRAGPQLLVSGQTVIYREHGLRGRLQIGQGVRIGAQVVLDYSGGCILGNNVWISHRAAFFTHEHPMRGTKENSDVTPEVKPLTVGDNAWIGYGAIILPSVGEIGEGAIIGAGAVVTKRVPAYAIAVGNPATIKGDRLVLKV